MNSRYASSTPSKFGDVIHLNNTSNDPIPSIDPKIVFKGSTEFNDADSMLDEIAVRTSIASSPSSMTLLDDDPPKPRACRNLRALMKNGKREKFKSRISPRNRLESFVDVELKEKEDEFAKGSDKENVDTNDSTETTSKKRLRSTRFQKPQSMKKAKNAEHSPVVWVIESSFNKDGTLRFKFTTDVGACLILKDKEALESITIMKDSSRTNAYFQVYSTEGKESRVIKPDQISQAIEEIIAKSKPKLKEEDVLTSDAPAKTKRCIGHRFYRFLLRRRWKKLVRRQVRIATGESSKRRGLVSIILPFSLIWKRAGAKNRASV